MPLRMQVSQLGKERPSQTEYNPLDVGTIEAIRARYELPATTPIEGIMFSETDKYCLFHADNLMPMLAVRGIEPQTTRFDPVTLPLPSPFAHGNVSISILDENYQGKLQSELQFDEAPDFPIHYQTHPVAYDNAHSVAVRSELLATLPLTVLQTVREKGPVVILEEEIGPGRKLMGFDDDGHIKILSWDRKHQRIEALALRIPLDDSSTSVYWFRYANAGKQAIAQAQGVFVVVQRLEKVSIVK